MQTHVRMQRANEGDSLLTGRAIRIRRATAARFRAEGERGGPRSSFWRWWAWPLPPPGPLEFVCEWPPFGIPETRAGLDGQLILDAAARSIRLWPEDDG